MVLEIMKYPAEVLKLKARPVEVIDGSIRQLCEDMIETMYEANGIGLAAPQVGESICLLVLDVSEERNSPIVIINPFIEKHSKRKVSDDEGCLSVPGITVAVDRWESISLSYQDLAGQEIELEADGLLGRCIQHEMDHLTGMLLIDKTTESERFRVRDDLRELEGPARL